MNDIEQSQSVSTSKKDAVKPTFGRKWGPALVAILAVLAVNLALLGPSGQKIPPLTEQQVHVRKLEQERTHAALAFVQEPTKMDSTARYESSERNTSMRSKFQENRRNLSKSSLSSSDIMEYTRRRHRLLGDYVHEDVSGQFSAFGK